MSLYIRDTDVDDLAKKVLKASPYKNKTEAVRIALQNELRRLTQEAPLTERIAEIQARVKAEIGDTPVLFDHKAFMDDGWEV